MPVRLSSCCFVSAFQKHCAIYCRLYNFHDSMILIIETGVMGALKGENRFISSTGDYFSMAGFLLAKLKHDSINNEQ